jgi:hypothetical protein
MVAEAPGPLGVFAPDGLISRRFTSGLGEAARSRT